MQPTAHQSSSASEQHVENYVTIPLLDMVIAQVGDWCVLCTNCVQIGRAGVHVSVDNGRWLAIVSNDMSDYLVDGEFQG